MNRITFLLIVLLGWLPSKANALPQSEISPSGDQYILLRSGGILEGQVETRGTDSRILFPGGDYFVLPSEQIEKTFRSRRDVFRYKIAVTPMEPRAQHQLLTWLCEHQAFEFAERQLADIPRNDPIWNLFDHADWLNRIRRQAERDQLKDPTTSAVSPAAENSEDRFRTDVEKHLVLGCHTAGCHGRTADFRYQLTGLLEAQAGQANASNYRETLRMIKELGPRKFLEHVSKPHGPLQRGMYPTATREYLAIATWTNSLDLPDPASDPPIGKPVPAQRSDIRPLASIPKIPVIEPPRRQSPAPRENQHLANSGPFVPRDEFDPEIFNRLQRQKRDPATRLDGMGSGIGQVPDMTSKSPGENTLPRTLPPQRTTFEIPAAMRSKSPAPDPSPTLNRDGRDAKN